MTNRTRFHCWSFGLGLSVGAVAATVTYRALVPRAQQSALPPSPTIAQFPESLSLNSPGSQVGTNPSIPEIYWQQVQKERDELQYWLQQHQRRPGGNYLESSVLFDLHAIDACGEFPAGSTDLWDLGRRGDDVWDY